MLVVGARGWHPGVVGIVAAKLVDIYNRPSVVIAFEEDVGRGSRARRGFHLYQRLHGAAPLLLRYGGHAAAAGLSVPSTTLIRCRIRCVRRIGSEMANG